MVLNTELVVVCVCGLEHWIDCIRGKKNAEAKIDTVTTAACTTREMCSLATGVALVVYLRWLSCACGFGGDMLARNVRAATQEDTWS